MTFSGSTTGAVLKIPASQQYFTYVLGANTLIYIPVIPSGGNIRLALTQDATGGRVPAFQTNGRLPIVWDGDNPPTDSNTSVIAGTTTIYEFNYYGDVIEARIVNKAVTAVNPRDFGAIGDGVADDSAAVQIAINVAVSSGIKRVYFDPGTYYFPMGSTPLNPAPGDVTTDIDFIGAGKHASILKWDEGSSSVIGNPNNHPMFKNTSASLKGRVNFSHLQFQGTLIEGLAGGAGRVNVGGPGFYMEHFAEVNFDHCRFYGISNFAMSFEWVYGFAVTNCEFDTVMRDQVRYRSSFGGIVSNCTFRHSDDDSIALHQASYIQGTGTIHEGFIITNNYFEDTTGIHCLGPRIINVSNNVFRRCKLGAVRIDRDTGEGQNPMFGITIVGNVATDTLARPPFAAAASTVYSVIGNIPRAGSGSATLYPGANNSATPAMVPPWPYFENNDNDAAQAIPPAYAVNITDNTIMRTLPAVTNYSDWGFGEVLSNAGFTDPLVTDAALRPTAAITLGSNIVGVNVANNIAMNCTRGITFSDNSVKGLMRGIVGDNIIYDTPEYGIAFFGTGTAHIKVKDNDICLDPYHLSAGRASDGGWTSGYSPSIAISANGSLGGLIIKDNIIAECYRPISASEAILQNNTLKCFAFALGWSSSNLGIGELPAAGEAYTYIRVLSDTASTNINLLGQAPIAQAAAQPSSGFYVAGQTVRNTDLATFIHSWQRLTTGGSHVAGTDWGFTPWYTSTIAAPGTTGAVTINKRLGRVNIAAAGTSVVVTNNLVTANSIVIAIPATNDATARVTSVVPTAGSFTINTPAVTAETAFNFLVL